MKTQSTHNLKDQLRDCQQFAARLSVNASACDRPHYARSIIFIGEALNQIDSLFDSIEVPETGASNATQSGNHDHLKMTATR